MTASFQIRKAKNSAGWYWRLVAANGEPLAHSEVFTRAGDAMEGVRAAKEAVPKAVVDASETDDA